MTFTPMHYGLYFTPEHIKTARQNANREPFKTAGERLASFTFTGAPHPADLLMAGLIRRFFENETVGERAINPLIAATDRTRAAHVSDLDEIGDLLTLAHSFECLRDHAAFNQAHIALWLDAFAARVDDANTRSENASPLETLWLALLNVAAGIVLEDEARFQAGVDVFTATIREDVRPQGFIPKAVDGADGGSMRRQVLSSAALVLMAEAAAHVGVDLWSYAVRGVSAATTAIYPIYYFYTVEKWTWDAVVTVEDVQAIFRAHGGYLEIVHRRTGLKDIRTVLDDLRPVWDARGGGLTSLTHGIPIRRGLFG